MTWWRGCDKSHQNGKLLAVGLAGTGLHFRATSWCSSEETDGRLPVDVIPSLSPTLTPARRKELVAAMAKPFGTKDPLWTPEENEEGVVIAYWLHDYLGMNPSHAQLDAKRDAERKRLEAKRGSR